MTSESFKQGFLALSEAFPGTKFSANLMWSVLNDLDGQFFLQAVMEVIKTTKELFPGSNIVAILREKAHDVITRQIFPEQKRLEAESEQARIERWQKEATPMPDDCRAALAKIGIVLDEPRKI